MADVDAQVAAVTRNLRDEPRDGTRAFVQTLTQSYPSPIDEVWDAVTNRERIPRWFLPVSGELKRGGRYQLEGNAGGEVLECEPPQEGSAHYRVTWEYGGGVTWLAVRLTALAGEATTLELEHTSLESDIPPGFWDQFGPGATGVGWDSGLLGLALHLSRGWDANPEAAPSWPFTDEGRAFYRASADAWRDAHIAAGGAPDAAARAADATYGFYTGATPTE